MPRVPRRRGSETSAVRQGGARRAEFSWAVWAESLPLIAPQVSVCSSAQWAAGFI